MSYKLVIQEICEDRFRRVELEQTRHNAHYLNGHLRQ